jgi:hypothetical protein
VAQYLPRAGSADRAGNQAEQRHQRRGKSPHYANAPAS